MTSITPGVIFYSLFLLFTSLAPAQSWTQWGQNSQHAGNVPVAGQLPDHILADVVYDPFVEQEKSESGGDLTAHYQVPLISGDSVYQVIKTGAYAPCVPSGSGRPSPCGVNAWNGQT